MQDLVRRRDGVISTRKLSPNTKTILNVLQTGTPAISYARLGRFPTKALQASRLNYFRPRQSNISSGTRWAAAGNDGNSMAEAAQRCSKSNVALNGRFREMNVSGDEPRKSPWHAPTDDSLGSVGRESIALPSRSLFRLMCWPRRKRYLVAGFREIMLREAVKLIRSTV